jgi:hypothetical protein
VEGKNLAIECRFANFRPELLPEAARDLVRLNMKVTFALTPETVAAARNATTSIPVVALDLESDPLAMGYVKSLGRPGGNITGMFLDGSHPRPIVEELLTPYRVNGLTRHQEIYERHLHGPPQDCEVTHSIGDRLNFCRTNGKAGRLFTGHLEHLLRQCW